MKIDPSKTLMKLPLLSMKCIFSLVFILSVSFLGFAQEEPQDSTGTHFATTEQAEAEEELKVSEIILEHVMDSHTWHLTKSVIIPLPVIVYSSERGLQIFSSAHFYEHHKKVEYDGYRMTDTVTGEKIYRAESGKRVLDLSITKNVAMLFINFTLLLVVILIVSASYKKNRGNAPKGIQSFIEPVILFVKDNIAKPSIGPKYQKYLPYLLTLFFFILFGNLLGLLPGSGNLTGNIAVTLVLALLTFVIVNVNGNKTYWGHIFWTPGVPLPLRFIILPVELIGILTKPFSLTVRLFVAITAGHIVLLALLCMTFIFDSWFVGIGSSVFVVLISLIELLVAAIQAYVFTLFTALYIGQAVQEHEHEHKHEHAH